MFSGTYTVVAGDELNKIAAKYGTTAEAIAKLNSIPNIDRIEVGQQLQIPEMQALQTSTPSMLSTVKTKLINETLFGMPKIVAYLLIAGAATGIGLYMLKPKKPIESSEV